MTFIDFHSAEVKEAPAHLTRLRPVVGSELATPPPPDLAPTSTTFKLALRRSEVEEVTQQLDARRQRRLFLVDDVVTKCTFCIWTKLNCSSTVDKLHI